MPSGRSKRSSVNKKTSKKVKLCREVNCAKPVKKTSELEIFGFSSSESVDENCLHNNHVEEMPERFIQNIDGNVGCLQDNENVEEVSDHLTQHIYQASAFEDVDGHITSSILLDGGSESTISLNESDKQPSTSKSSRSSETITSFILLDGGGEQAAPTISLNESEPFTSGSSGRQESETVDITDDQETNDGYKGVRRVLHSADCMEINWKLKAYYIICNFQ